MFQITETFHSMQTTHMEKFLKCVTNCFLTEHILWLTLVVKYNCQLLSWSEIKDSQLFLHLFHYRSSSLMH